MHRRTSKRMYLAAGVLTCLAILSTSSLAQTTTTSGGGSTPGGGTTGGGGTQPPRYPMMIPDTMWRVHPDFTGRTRYSAWTPSGSSVFSVAWEPLTFGFSAGSRSLGFAHDARGAWDYTYCPGLVDSGGTINYNLEWTGSTAPANFRSFFTLGASASAGTGSTYGSSSATTNPSKNQSSSPSYSYSSGQKVYELSGTSGNLNVSLNAIATHPTGHGTSVDLLSQLSAGIRWHPHPVFTISGCEPNNKKRTSTGSTYNTRDGSQNGELDIVVYWHQNTNASNPSGATDPDPTGWVAKYNYTYSQDLYSSPKFSYTGFNYHPSLIVKYFGNDTSSSRLGESTNITSSLEDDIDSSNVKVDITTLVRWHKPLENPVKVGANYVVQRACNNVHVIEPSDLGQNPLAQGDGTVKVGFDKPGAAITVDSSGAGAYLQLSGSILGDLPIIGSILSSFGVLASEFNPEPTTRNPDPQKVFDSRWLNPYGDEGNRMSTGIQTNNISEHRLSGIHGVYSRQKCALWDCEFFGPRGYIGQGGVQSFKDDHQYDFAGNFIYIDPNGDPEPPDNPQGPGGPTTPTNPGTPTDQALTRVQIQGDHAQLLVGINRPAPVSPNSRC